MSGVLALAPDDYRVLGLALAEFATGKRSRQATDDDRDQAGALLDTLINWGLVPAGHSG